MADAKPSPAAPAKSPAAPAAAADTSAATAPKVESPPFPEDHANNQTPREEANANDAPNDAAADSPGALRDVPGTVGGSGTPDSPGDIAKRKRMARRLFGQRTVEDGSSGPRIRDPLQGRIGADTFQWITKKVSERYEREADLERMKNMGYKLVAHSETELERLQWEEKLKKLERSVAVDRRRAGGGGVGRAGVGGGGRPGGGGIITGCRGVVYVSAGMTVESQCARFG